jgi:hypothetical protein
MTEFSHYYGAIVNYLNYKKMKRIDQPYCFNVIAICFTVFVLMMSCNQNDDLAPQNNQNSTTLQEDVNVKDVVALSIEDPLLIALQKTDAITNFGIPQWRQSNLTTYSDTDVQSIIVPISETKAVIAYFRSGTQKFEVFVYEALSANTDNEKFSGIVNFYRPSGSLLQQGVFENGKLVGDNTAVVRVEQLGCDKCLIVAITDPKKVHGVAASLLKVCERGCTIEV